MVNILVPTDFSPLSRVAVDYAMRIAETLDGSITMLHVVDFQSVLKSTLQMKTGVREQLRPIQEQLVNVANDALSQSEHFPVINFKISRGNTFSDTILRESRRLKSGLIIMGTKGATGLKKSLMGSNTVSVLESSHIPVLVVPEKAQFQPFRNIIYATDMQSLEEELSVLIPYVKKFEATIHVLHITDDATKIESIEETINAAAKRTGYTNVVTLVTFDQEIDGAIESYIKVSRADMVAMFTRRTSFYERMMDKSLTRRLAFYTSIPLLAFRKGEG
jgi:nucleotide-binding universal stress UspA family protein